MSVAGLCVIFIPGWVGARKWQRQQEVVCTCWAFISPAGSGGGRVYIGACAGGNYCCVLDGCLLSLIYEAVASMIC